ncbi:molybdenum cofactor guanylyltransferase [Paenibacillus whitsoniae]|uniref:Molybdenum cofactor guanylyltransferase n=1 Tax=Paenibacillus whitsoniae TaxID=2496558 RepID=A0A430JK29_9BACL|nr:molybdenum cofactor guanylyltransferase [Paenibacillus whitsoniae]
MLTGVILAGGESRRMNGQVKALLPFDGQPLIARQLERMRAVCTERIVVTGDPRPLLPVLDRSVRVITDYYAGCGIIGGLHAALSLARNAEIWAVGCDMPLISGEAAVLMQRSLQDGADAVLPRIGGAAHPLHGIYRRRAVEKLQPLLEAREADPAALLRRLRWQALPEARLREHGIALDAVASIKTPADYERLLQLCQTGV